MTTGVDFSQFKNESHVQKIKELARTDARDLVFILFGGTGAVGGTTVLELVETLEYVIKVSPEWAKKRLLIVATGASDNERQEFKKRLFIKTGKDKWQESGQENQNANQHETISLKTATNIEVSLRHFRADPKIDISDNIVQLDDSEQLKAALVEASQKASFSFINEVKSIISEYNLPIDIRIQSVISGIALPSLAAYGLGGLYHELKKYNNTDIAADKDFDRTLKLNLLRGYAQQFGIIKKEYASEMIVAHTTSVGGMYVMKDGKPVINLGYAHKAVDEEIEDKQYYANKLTDIYTEQGIKILITASAIGVDNVSKEPKLYLHKDINSQFIDAKKQRVLPFDEDYISESKNSVRIFEPCVVHKAFDKGTAKQLNFSAKKEADELTVKYGLRSGENGIFSIDNAYALYLNMKIASQEELAHVIAFNSLFGDDQQKRWFNNEGICYYSESDNSTLAFALLNNQPQLRAYQTSGFTPKAFQDLGLAKHQCELHTTGMYQLLHKVRLVDNTFVAEIANTKRKFKSAGEAADYVDQQTSNLTIEDVVAYDSKNVSDFFAEMLSLKAVDDLKAFLNLDKDLSDQYALSFVQCLLEAINRTINTITSLGSPIIYRKDGEDKILTGPYCAPLDIIVDKEDTIATYIADFATLHQLPYEGCFEWFVCNRGFVDLRPGATVTTAFTCSNKVSANIWTATDNKDFRKKVEDIQDAFYKDDSYSYFTSSGVAGFIGRMSGLYDELQAFDISLGTLNTWKTLFPVDNDAKHPIIPGLIEAMRMYTEGLGKVTGHEALYPGFGYFKS